MFPWLSNISEAATMMVSTITSCKHADEAGQIIKKRHPGHNLWAGNVIMLRLQINATHSF